MEHLSPHRALIKPLRGFTLIEMLVVLAIIVVLMSIVFSGQLNFNRTLSLNNAAYDIALTLRQAQSYGLSSQAFFHVNNPGYGVYFQKAAPTSYIFFSDIYPAVSAGAQPDARPGNSIYDATDSNSDGVPDETVQTYSLNNGFTLSAFCVYATGPGRVCTTGSLTALSVTFSRPNAITTIKGNTGSWGTYTNACVKMSSLNGDTRYISVSQTGEVQAGASTIDTLTCP